MPDKNYPGCFVYIRVKIAKNGDKDQVAIDTSTVAYATDSATPYIWFYPGAGDIQLPVNNGRPFAFVLAYDVDGNNNNVYTWDANALQNIKIWEVGTTEPAWGTALPSEFRDLKPGNATGLLTFIDSYGSRGKSFNYCVRLTRTGMVGSYSDPLDPRITNSTN